MTSVRPFQLYVSDEMLADIRARVAAFPWHEMPDDGGWQYGANLDYMKELCAYWTDRFDWRAQEVALTQFSHYVAPVDGLDIHFIHEKGSGPNPIPLMISHGWPGSVAEFTKVIEPLTHPERHGLDPSLSFDVIAPSLPGFGYSGPPPRPYGPRKMAGLINKLMTEVLGYGRYVAQGGDWGGAVSSWLGFDHASACKAIHINILITRHPDGPQGH